MRRRGRLSLLAVLVLCAATVVSVAAWGEVTLWREYSGEVEWWYIGEHPDEVCGVEFTNACDLVTGPYGDQWAVELAAYGEDDWAQVSLNAKREGFTFADVEDTTLTFSYRILLNPVIASLEPYSGPRLAFWLVNGEQNYLVISETAEGDTPQTASACVDFTQVSGLWWRGEVDTLTDDGKEYVDINSMTTMTPGTFADAQAPAVYGGYEVKAVLVVMGGVGQLDPASVVAVVGGAITAAAAAGQDKITVTNGDAFAPGDLVFIQHVVGPYAPLGESNEVESVAGNVLTLVSDLQQSYVATDEVRRGAPIGAGQAIVDNVVLEWTEAATTHGGTYHLEKEWAQTIGFDDWTSTPPADSEVPPAEWARWCADSKYCPHCLPVDDQNLWTIVKETDFPTTVPTAAKAFPSGDYAIYFGTKTEGNYDRGEAAVGTVCSPYNEVNPADKYVSLSFDYFRQVESYMGKYDWTFVQIAFYDGNGVPIDRTVAELGDDPTRPADVDDRDRDCDEWKTIWYMDSSDASTGQWEEAVITHYVDEDGDTYTDNAHRIEIPRNATRMRIRFGFNSVDGSQNNYLGWIIDNVVKTHSPDPSGCRIITDHLPQGEVGDKYPAGSVDTGFQLDPEVTGLSTTGPRSWSIVSVTKDGVRTSLPRRLALDPSGILYGELDPGTSGTYEITFQLDCYNGRPQVKTLVMNVRGPVSDVESLIRLEDFEDGSDQLFLAGELPAGDQSCPYLWHQTNLVRYALEALDVRDEYGSVAYFGKDDFSDDFDPNYDCTRAKDCLESIPVPITKPEWDGEELIIGFKSWRNVEFFAGGEYDKTWVEARVTGGNWVVVWSKSSKDASLAEWTWEEARTGIILQEDKKVQVRFCFDSIDGYRNKEDGEAYGWLIDEVTLYAGGAELAITGCPRGETSVGESYYEEIHASGGTGFTALWDTSAGALPPGIGIVSDGRTAYLSGVARTEGRYDFTIRVRSADWDQVATRPCTIIVTRDVTLLFEDFENDPAWGGTGLWHYTPDGGVEGVPDLNAVNHAAYYGKGEPTSPNYDTVARTDGMLTLVTPVISLTGVDAVKVQFDSWREVENFGNGGYDKTYVQVKLGDGDWTTIWERDSGDACADEWISEEGITPFLTGGASTMLIRFVFDSVDRWYNNFPGWLVDNIKIHSAPLAGANPLSVMRIESGRTEGRDTPAELQVINVPNPITDVHTTTFMVRSPDVVAMRIQIFDLAGSIVYEEEVSSNELVWHTDNYYGEYLANGIYLYRASVLIGGVWVETTVQKLVILR
jgi:hypothetical protein